MTSRTILELYLYKKDIKIANSNKGTDNTKSLEEVNYIEIGND